MEPDNATQSLLIREEIKQLKARYFRLMDTKQWQKFAAVFTEDADAQDRVASVGMIGLFADLRSDERGLEPRVLRVPLFAELSVRELGEPVAATDAGGEGAVLEAGEVSADGGAEGHEGLFRASKAQIHEFFGRGW